jgi:hypothetical protein
MNPNENGRTVSPKQINSGMIKTDHREVTAYFLIVPHFQKLFIRPIDVAILSTELKNFMKTPPPQNDSNGNKFF